MSRHRGAKHRRQYELSSGISLFNYVHVKAFNLYFLVSLQGSDYIINQNLWLSGTRVRIIVSATHLLVVGPARYLPEINTSSTVT